MKKDWFNLSWLTAPPPDFTARCNALGTGDADEWRRLATFRLDDNQLRKIAKRRADLPVPKGFESFRLGVISNANSDFLVPALEASALRYGVWLDVTVTGMGNGIASIMDAESELNRARPDAVLIAYTWHTLGAAAQAPGDATGAAAAVHHLLEEIEMMTAMLAKAGILPIVQTMPQAPLALFGSLDGRVAGTLRSMIDAFNKAIMSKQYSVIDTASLAETAGTAAWYDPVQWCWAKIPFAQALIPLYADHVARFIGAVRGRSRKCLVLDLDNTLWGGVIGDDGVEGIELGQGSPLGEAYLALQKWALALRARGVVLAVCSKNDEENARLPFRLHPEQVLKEDHIAVFQANWEDKAGNIEEIARKLELTPDALVFLDDNPAERDIVRRELPVVAVPEVPDAEPALWPLIVSAAGYFEAAQFTEADRDRADQYTANAHRETLKGKSRDLGEYLRSLEMVMEISPITPLNRNRVAQLVSRSNQYNLTTHRYTEDQLALLADDRLVSTFAVRLRDRFGDNGLISVVICRDEGKTWSIDTWLMSCRVLGREVQNAVLNHVAAQALAAGKMTLTGRYLPSAKNAMTKDHYKKLGFLPAGEKVNGETEWLLDLKAFQPFNVPMTAVPVEAALTGI